MVGFPALPHVILQQFVSFSTTEKEQYSFPAVFMFYLFPLIILLAVLQFMGARSGEK